MALPADIQDALDQYDADVATGKIKFGSEGFADSYPGETDSDASLMSFIASKVDAL